MTALTGFTGRAILDMALQVRPRMTLTFYDHAILMRKENDAGVQTEYPIDPAALAPILASQIEYSTGLLSPNTLYIGQTGANRRVIEYRPPEMTAFWVEGSDEPFRIPMCPLIMVRTTQDGRAPSYKVFAVKDRPEGLDAALFCAPFPNVSTDGVCWGTVPTPTREELAGNSLAPDWRQFLGSRFGNHSLSGKSRKYRSDARKLFLEMAEKRMKRYPLGDLVAIKKTFGDLLYEKD